MTTTISSIPDATASSTTIWMAGLSTTGKISLGMTLDAGSIRVPIPAATITALRTFMADYAANRTRLALAFARFLSGFAGDAEGSHGPRLEPFEPDLVAAFFATPIAAAVDAGKRLVDFGEQLPLPIAHSQLESAVRFQASTVRRVRARLFRFVVHRPERSLRLSQNLLLAALEEAAKGIQIPLSHIFGTIRDYSGTRKSGALILVTAYC